MKKVVVRALIALLSLLVSSSARAQQPFAPSVPIKIPAGTRGMQPGLALVYSPNGGDGLLGMGWSLTGLSAITRVNYGNGINYDTHDSYAHSGAGVLLKQPDGTYRSKKESFIRFQPVGSCGTDQGPCSWTATDRSGTKYFYGATPIGGTCTYQTQASCDSQLWVQDNVGVKVWALSGVQDLFGNYYTVNYYQDAANGQLTPNTIQYTLGPGLGSSGYRTITFDYYDRATTDPSVEKRFYSTKGYPQTGTKLLHHITVTSWANAFGWSSTPIRRYELNYQDGTSFGLSGRKQLASVQEQGWSGSAWVGLPAQTFEWQQGGLQQFLPPNTDWAVSQGPWSTGAQYLPGDYDGDGKTDMAFVYNNGGSVYIKVHLAGAAATQADVWEPIGATPQAWMDPKTFLAGDFNGDGRTDIAYVHKAATGTNRLQIEVYVATVTGKFARTLWYTGADGSWITDQYGNWQGYNNLLTGDFNGDGKTDIAHHHLASYRDPFRGIVYIGNIELYEANNGTFYNSGGATTENTWDSAWQTYMTFVTGDFDGDGRTDIMQISNSNPKHGEDGAIALNLFRGAATGGIAAAQSTNWGTSGTTWHTCKGQASQTGWTSCGTFITADVNGDGMTDLVYLWDNYTSTGNINSDVFISKGRTAHAETHAPTAMRWQGAGLWQKFGTFVRGDYNGDGIPDIAYAWHSATGSDTVTIDVLKFQQDWFDGCTNCGFTASENWEQQRVVWPGGVNWSDKGAILPADVVGRGMTSLVFAWVDGAGQAHYSLHVTDATGPLTATLTPDLMVATHNGIGGEQRATYQAGPTLPGVVNPTFFPYPYVANPSPQQLVTSVFTKDGRGGSFGTSYQYYGAMFLSGSIPNQRNMGFSRVVATDSTGMSIDTTYRQYDGFEGNPTEVYVRAANGTLMKHSTYSYYPLLHPANQDPANQTEFVELQTQVDSVYDLDSLAYNVTTTYQYDANGNVTDSVAVPDGISSGKYPHLKILYSTDPNDQARWILDRVTEVQTYASVITPTALMKDVKLIWTQDKATSVQEWVTGSQWVTTSLGYNANGLPTSVTEPPTEDQIPRITTIAYDQFFHAYPATVTDALGHITQKYYTPAGQLASVSGPNSSETTSVNYDAFGRKSQVTTANGACNPGCSAYGSWTKYTYPNLGDPNNQNIRTETLLDTRTIVTSDYFDGMGFPYRAEHTGDSGQTICVFAQKDNSGRQTQVSTPTFNCAHGGDAWTIATFDPASRIATVTSPDQKVTTYAYGAPHPSNNQRFVSVTDPNGRTTTTWFDALGNTARTIDALGQAMSYDYDAMGRSHGWTLPNGGVSQVDYDGLGRKLDITSNDGIATTTYSYYDNGNLKTTTQAGKTVTWHYDALNRVTEKDPQGENAISYRYDESAYQNSIGRLTTISDAAGTTHYSYLPMGEIAAVQKTIDSTSFTQTYGYDHGGRLTQLGYPDGSIAQYNYTDGNHLSTVVLNSVLQATWTNYDASGAPQYVKYGNSITTTYTRDVVEHLTHLTTTTNTGTALQDLTFDWYFTNTNIPTNGLALGNVHDNRLTTIASDGTNTNETQTFYYDALYRLTAAVGVWGSRAYAYDGGSNGVGIGNPTTFGGYTQRTLNFNNGNPANQQVLSGSDGANWNLSNVQYDPSGNMTHKQLNGELWDYAWSTENRLMAAKKNGMQVATMVYDTFGQRVKKNYFAPDGTSVSTTYIDGIYEKRVVNGTTQRHTLNLFGNGDLILSWTRDGNIATASLDQPWRTNWAAASMAGMYLRLALILLLFALGAKALLRLGSRHLLRPRLVALSTALAVCVSACAGPAERIGITSRAVQTGDTLRGPGLGTFYYHRNHLGSSAVITDQTGKEVSRTLYLPFGETAAANSSGADVVTHKYTGQESDEELGQAALGGLYYYNARYYDPSIGRFISADSIVPQPGNAQAHNRYSYVLNNPINHTDPSGHGGGYNCNDPTTLCSEDEGQSNDDPDDSGGAPGGSPGYVNTPYYGPSYHSPGTTIPPGFGDSSLNWRSGAAAVTTMAPGAAGHPLPGDPNGILGKIGSEMSEMGWRWTHPFDPYTEWFDWGRVLDGMVGTGPVVTTLCLKDLKIGPWYTQYDGMTAYFSFGAGVGDALTLGISGAVRNALYPGVVPEGAMYYIGVATGTIASVGLGEAVGEGGGGGPVAGERGPYIPRNANGEPIPLPQQTVNGVDIPTPDPLAEGPHTTLGGRVGEDGVLYRQSATFPENTWPQANGQDVPWGRTDWSDHARPWDHTDPHTHPFEYDRLGRGGWYEGDRRPGVLP